MREEWQVMTSFERSLRARGYQYIAGIDEAGRGPLAGPVVAAAVILKEDCEILGLTDSKKLSKQKEKTIIHTLWKKPQQSASGSLTLMRSMS